MLSLDLFATQFEKELREGAVDDLEYRRMNDLREKMEMLMQAYKKADTDEVKAAIMKRYKEYKAEREGYMKVREQQVPSKQDPFAYVKPEPKGIGDIQDPKQKMAQLAQQSKKGALANVGAGLKAFIKGEPEPMGEQQQVSPRALGVANFQRLVKANMGNLPSVNFEFIRPEENFKLDTRGLDLISDYYDGLENDQAKNYFIYRVLPSGEETLKVLKQLGWSPTAGQQQSLPGIPTQGELPLQEKKKSNSDDLEAGDVKVARELQKLRAQYPAAKSDIEAVARAEIDSTERSQQQLAAIRGANEKQDALLKQLVALDQEQGREIDGLDKENNSLEQRLAQVQATNDRLQQAIGKMTGTKKAASAAKPISPDAAQGGIIDVGVPMAPEPMPTSRAKAEPTTSSAMDYTVQQLGGFSNKPLASLRPVKDIGKDASNDPKQQTQKVSGSDIEEHGGGIGPKKHWQSMMPEGQPQELIHRYLAIDAENDVDAVRAAIQAISRDPALGANSKSRLLGQIGMIIKRHRLPIGRAYYQFMRQYMEDINETALTPNDPQSDYEAKRRALHDLSLNKDVDQQAVLQRRLDLDREAKAKGLAETVTNVKAGMAEIYRRLAPKIERHRDSFLAGQLYDELENYAELHGAEGEFKRMMATARNSAHMEYDTNPGGFQNWFWFLPFEDNMEEGIKSQLAGAALAGALALGAGSANARVTGDEDPRVNRLTGKPNVTQAVQGDQVKPSAPTGFSKEYLQSVVDGTHPRPMITKEKAQALLNQLKEQGVVESTDDVKKRMSKLEALALAANRAGDDAKCKMYQQKIQSLKQKLSQSMAEGWSDQGNPTPYSVYIDGREWRAYKSDDHARAVAEKVRANLKKQGRDQTVTIAPSKAKKVQEDFGMPGTTIPRKSVIQGYTVFFNPKNRVISVTRGGDSEEAAIEQQKLSVASMKNFRLAVERIIDRIEGLAEGREIQTREDFIRERDRLLRMIGIETDPANKQILKSAIRQLENRAENEGWITIQSRMVREDSDGGEAVEMAIMRRMLVAHTDLIVEFGLDKVVDAIEEVAYNVGDTDEIGSSDVSGWVRQVERILGVEA